MLLTNEALLSLTIRDLAGDFVKNLLEAGEVFGLLNATTVIN